MSVFLTEEIEILKKMSVLNFKDNYVKFSHNVLQEFLTAKLLSSKIWFKTSKNWKEYVVSVLFSRKAQVIPKVLISSIQCWYDEINFKVAITDKENGSWSVNENAFYYSEFFLFFDLEIPKSKLLEMLNFDIYGSSRHSVEKAKETITDKVIRLIGEELVGSTLLENLIEGNLSFRVLENHVGRLG